MLLFYCDLQVIYQQSALPESNPRKPRMTIFFHCLSSLAQVPETSEWEIHHCTSLPISPFPMIHPFYLWLVHFEGLHLLVGYPTRNKDI